MGVIQWAKKLSFDAEHSILNDTNPQLWSRYYTGINRGVLRSHKMLALLSTFSRSIPAIPNAKRERLALNKALRAWTSGPPNDEQITFEDTLATTKLRKELFALDDTFWVQVESLIPKHPINSYRLLIDNSADMNLLLEMATRGLTLDRLEEVGSGKYHAFLPLAKFLREEIDLYNIKKASMQSQILSKVQTLRRNSKRYQTLLELIEKSRRRVTVPKETVNLASIQTFVEQTISKLNRNRPVPVKLSGYLSNAACYERSRAKGGAYRELKEELDTRLKALAHERGTTVPRLLSDYHPFKTMTQDQVWEKVIESKLLVEPKSRICIIPEKGGKYRVANVADVGTVANAQPLGDQVISILKRHPALKGEYDADPQYIASRLYERRGRNVKRTFYSTDMNQSTDTLRKDVIYACINGLASALKWTSEQRSVAMRTVMPMKLYKDKKLLGQNLTGTLLGLPLSFAVLCLCHLYCVNRMSPTGARRTVVYGDDMATYCTEDDWNKYVTTCNSVGFTLNTSKTHIAEHGFVFCGKTYRIIGDHCHWIKTTKLSIVTGASSQTKSFDKRLSQTADATHCVQHKWQVARITKAFCQKNKYLVHQLKRKGIPLIGPVIGGACGFKGRPLPQTRKIACFNFKIEYNPFKREWDSYKVANHIRKAMNKAYDLTENYLKTKRTTRKDYIRLDDAHQVLLTSLVTEASMSLFNDKFSAQKTNGILKTLKNIRRLSNYILKEFGNEQNRSNLGLPGRPSPAYVKRLIQSNKNRRVGRLDPEVIGNFLNQQPCRYTFKHERIPNFDVSLYLKSRDKQTRRDPSSVHSMLRIKC
jgi:hypothetical protein